MSSQDFIRTVAALAIRDYATSKVLPSTVIAQACLESNFGKSAPGNNYFGIKGSGGVHVTQEFVNGRWETVEAAFAGYDSLEASVKAHGSLLTRLARYAAIPGNKDYHDVCYILQKAGYATDPAYSTKLVTIIEAYGLTKYDKEVSNMQEQIDVLKAQVDALQKLASMPIPAWAKDAVDAAVKAKLIDTPNGGSQDFYRIIAVLHRKGVI